MQGKFYLSLLQNVSQGELKSYSHLHNLCNPKSRPDTVCGEDWPQTLNKIDRSNLCKLIYDWKNSVFVLAKQLFCQKPCNSQSSSGTYVKTTGILGITTVLSEQFGP